MGWVAEKGRDRTSSAMCCAFAWDEDVLHVHVSCTREKYIYIYIHTSPTGWPIRNIILNTGGLCTYPTYLPSYSTSADDT